MANVKLGNNTLAGVTTVRLQNADAAGEYVSFGLGAAPAEHTHALSDISGVTVTATEINRLSGVTDNI